MSEAGKELCKTLCEAFGRCLESLEAEGSDDKETVCVCIEVCEAARKVVPLYDKIFGEGMVSSTLKKDLDGSATGCMTVVLKNPVEYRTILGLVEGEVASRGLEVVRKDKNSGVVKLLWMKRALEFIALFLQYSMIDMVDKSTRDAGTAAYDKVLKPYHGTIVSAVVSAAFRLAPNREKLLQALGFDSMEDATVSLRMFLEKLQPVLTSIDGVLAENNCAFTDKA